MLKLKVIGCGAAGNKAAIALHKKGFDLKNITLINSTSRDIPEEYKQGAMIFGASNESLGGCGKERLVGQRLILKDLEVGTIKIESCIDPDTNAVVIVSSTEGGSGSGVTPILAKYINQVCKLPVIVCLFFGFNSDVRGMQNSIEICQDLNEDYGVIGISNSSYLEEANGNKIKAEQLANEEFCKIIRILTGQDIHPGTQNIDDTDLYKLVVTPGYMFVGNASLKGVKNIDGFNKIITNALDESHLVDTRKKSVKRIGAIFTIPDSMGDFINIGMDPITQRYGTPYEMFTHIQTCAEGMTPSVSWIVSGMDLPIDEIKEIFESFKAANQNVNKAKDQFFSEVDSLQATNIDNFDMLSGAKPTANNAAARDSFFKAFK